MRSAFILSVFLAQVVHAPCFAQQNSSGVVELQGVVLVRLNPSTDSALGSAFYSSRPTDDPTFSHSEIEHAILSGDSLIGRLLGLPSELHGLRLRPFIPTHSVAFEDIRERSNPQL